jgi:hypothetical protein
MARPAEQLSGVIRIEEPRWRKVIRDANVKGE